MFNDNLHFAGIDGSIYSCNSDFITYTESFFENEIDKEKSISSDKSKHPVVIYKKVNRYRIHTKVGSVMVDKETYQRVTEEVFGDNRKLFSSCEDTPFQTIDDVIPNECINKEIIKE